VCRKRVAGDLGVPDAVKFDSAGFIVSTQVASGQVLRIDPRNGSQTVLAQLTPGLDNLTFVGDRLFVSNFTGEITEILSGGDTSTVLPGGLNWPLDLAMSDDGNLYVADGTYFYVLRADGSLETAGMLFSPAYPGFLRGLAAAGAGEFVVTTSGGQVARYRPRCERNRLPRNRLRPALRCGDRTGATWSCSPNSAPVACTRCDRATSKHSRPACSIRSALPSTPTAGPWSPSRVRAGWSGCPGRGVETVVDGLAQPQGIVVADGRLYIVDAGAKEVLAVGLDSNERRTIASGLPVGPPPGVEPKPLKGMPPFSGPQGPFAGITAGPDGTLYVSADGDGSVLALRRVDT